MGRPLPLLSWALSTLAVAAAGCRDEWPPERLPTTAVRGRVLIGRAPVGGGRIQFAPVEGTPGKLRISPIRPDGSFEADRVPVGRVLVGLDRIPVGAVPTSAGPFDPRGFGSLRSPIRRTIPPGPGADLAIDLIDEATRAGISRRSGRRRKNRTPRKPGRNGGGTATDDFPPDDLHPPRPEPRVRVIYRDGSGTIHLEWPAERIPEAVADLGGTVWIDVEDIEAANNASVEAMFRDVFRFHPLAIEDALQDTHVPKIDDWAIISTWSRTRSTSTPRPTTSGSTSSTSSSARITC